MEQHPFFCTWLWHEHCECKACLFILCGCGCSFLQLPSTHTPSWLCLFCHLRTVSKTHLGLVVNSLAALTAILPVIFNPFLYPCIWLPNTSFKSSHLGSGRSRLLTSFLWYPYLGMPWRSLRNASLSVLWKRSHSGRLSFLSSLRDFSEESV